MENSNQQSNSYIIGSASFVPNLSSDPKLYQMKIPLTISSQPKIAGWLVLVRDWYIPAKIKPDQKHLDNMKEMFGWEWIDNVY